MRVRRSSYFCLKLLTRGTTSKMSAVKPLPTVPISEKVVIITGANSGIGAGIAIHLAKVGYKKLALLARRKEKLDEVAEKCRKIGVTDVLVLAKDLLVENSSLEAIKEAVEHFGSEIFTVVRPS